MTSPIGPRIGQTQRPQPTPASLGQPANPVSLAPLIVDLGFGGANNALLSGYREAVQQKAINDELNTILKRLSPPSP